MANPESSQGLQVKIDKRFAPHAIGLMLWELPTALEANQGDLQIETRDTSEQTKAQHLPETRSPTHL